MAKEDKKLIHYKMPGDKPDVHETRIIWGKFPLMTRWQQSLAFQKKEEKWTYIVHTNPRGFPSARQVIGSSGTNSWGNY